MPGFKLRRVTGFGAVALVGLLSSASANAGACDAKKARSLVGKSYSPASSKRRLSFPARLPRRSWARALSGRRTTAPTAWTYGSTMRLT
jgi:hypothetical protein